MARNKATLLMLALLSGVGAAASPAFAREVVEASAPGDVSVTVYRDPNRGEGQELRREWPRGFAMVSETRTVTLPPGESTIRFSGVAEGMVAVSAIVTGLPGGTIEKNRNADLLSPAALVDGTLGNRVTITRTNPATGAASSEPAIVRTRADGGLVLQTQQGFEAVRCSGLPEKITFSQIPAGLSAQPVFSIDTRDEAGGTYDVVLTYLAWGFDWQPHYVATLEDGAAPRGKQQLKLRSWLTVVNDNGQTFEDAQLLAVAGRLNVQSDFQQLADPPAARALRLTCYPLGSTSAGSPVPPPPMLAPMAPAMNYAMGDSIVVTAQRASSVDIAEEAKVMTAGEENLGDLKLYRVPVPVDVSAKSMKQVAFLDRSDVEGEFFYRADCSPYRSGEEPEPMVMMLQTVNDRQHGLGVALPMGGVSLFENASAGDLLVAEEWMRDYAEGQDVELELAESTNLFALCTRQSAAEPDDEGSPWVTMRAALSNAGSRPAKVRLTLGSPAAWQVRGSRGLSQKDGQWIIERTIPNGRATEISWEVRRADAD